MPSHDHQALIGYRETMRTASDEEVMSTVVSSNRRVSAVEKLAASIRAWISTSARSHVCTSIDPLWVSSVTDPVAGSGTVRSTVFVEPALAPIAAIAAAAKIAQRPNVFTSFLCRKETDAWALRFPRGTTAATISVKAADENDIGSTRDERSGGADA